MIHGQDGDSEALDPLDDILRALRLRASVYFSGELCGAWKLEHDGQRAAAFHVLARGACLLTLPGFNDPVELKERDLLILPRNSPHTLRSGQADEAGATVDAVTLVCGRFLFEHSRSNFILDVLPDYLLIRADEPASEPVAPVVRLIAEETVSKRLASGVIVDRLADVLFATVVRCHAEARPQQVGLLAALADRQVAKAMALMHSQPSREWRLGELADQVGLSSSALIERFNARLGLTPIEYLCRWKMLKAHELLATTEAKISEIAVRVGYQSEASFCKAFKKRMGVSPGQVRRSRVEGRSN